MRTTLAFILGLITTAASAVPKVANYAELRARVEAESLVMFAEVARTPLKLRPQLGLATNPADGRPCIKVYAPSEAAVATLLARYGTERNGIALVYDVKDTTPLSIRPLGLQVADEVLFEIPETDGDSVDEPSVIDFIREITELVRSHQPADEPFSGVKVGAGVATPGLPAIEILVPNAMAAEAVLRRYPPGSTIAGVAVRVTVDPGCGSKLTEI